MRARLEIPTLTYPESKLTIIGGGIVGFLEAYYAYLDARSRGERIRVTIHDKNDSISDTTTAHLVPSLTPDEILSVVPRGEELIKKLSILFSAPGGIRVDDVTDVNDTPVAHAFQRAVQTYGQNEEGHRLRTETLLTLGKMSMELWQTIYENGDEELQSILRAANFNPCRERTSSEPVLYDGYRIDLIYNMPSAAQKANAMKSDYERLGYLDCKLLSPDEVMQIDPFLTDFCFNHSVVNAEGARIWKDNAVALWRPGGCIDTQVFLPLFRDYLSKVMGLYKNEEGVVKYCFRHKLQRQVTAVVYEPSTNRVNGLSFYGRPGVKHDKHHYPTSSYVVCPGESVGTLRQLGFAEPAYARFAGASLMLKIDLSQDQLERYAKFKHCMEVHQEGVVLAWQARLLNNQIFIGVAGTKAFYADQNPHRDQAFAKNRNLLQLNMVNEVLPEIVSIAFGRNTAGITLTQADMDELEAQGIALRWVGTRAVAYDGFPTVGRVHNGHGPVDNVRCTTHLGSGGVSFSPATVLVSQSVFKDQSAQSAVPQQLTKDVLSFGNSQR